MSVTEAALAAVAVAPTLAQSGWRRFCQAMTAIFYRRRETSGLEHLPPRGPVILCANHVNALVDAVVIQASFAGRFQSLQRLIEAHRWLRLTRPDEVRVFRERLKRFERICRRHGVDDYHLHLRYRPALVAKFLARSLAFALFVFPLALWGLASSALPYLATRAMTRLTARGRDQYDTAGMLFGLVLFLVFWGGQTAAVLWKWGAWPAALYGASLPLTAAVALMVAKERRRITENVRVFFLFARKRQVREYLRLKRQELEIEVARMVRLARQGQ